MNCKICKDFLTCKIKDQAGCEIFEENIDNKYELVFSNINEIHEIYFDINRVYDALSLDNYLVDMNKRSYTFYSELSTTEVKKIISVCKCVVGLRKKGRGVKGVG